MIPAVSKVRSNAHQAKCVNNLRQLVTAATMYASENKGNFPSLNDGVMGQTQVPWFTQLLQYIDDENSKQGIELINCPASEHYLEVDGNRKTTHAYGWNCRLIPDIRTRDDGSKRQPGKTISVQRPSQTILSQMPDSAILVGGDSDISPSQECIIQQQPKMYYPTRHLLAMELRQIIPRSARGTMVTAMPHLLTGMLRHLLRVK